MKKILILPLLAVLLPSTACASLLERDDVRTFLSAMEQRHGFARSELSDIFGRVRLSDSVLTAISRPAETMPWHRYRQIFLQPDRIRQGAEFWRNNAAALERAREVYGVPEELIVAIIGVETRYGRNTGQHKVIDALATLAFDFPRRSQFFMGELEQYLLLVREQDMDPHALKGSYAGAMGIPQFISSSYRRYAVDFDGDGRVDIWTNPADAIGSVGNYFSRHGWLKGGLVTLPATVDGNGLRGELSAGLEPDLAAADLERLGIAPPMPLPAGEKVRILELEQEHGMEYWLGFWNFYVITRYNHSALYAMAVYQLADRIRGEYAGRAASGE
jgi:membrane-bound lytic murein transglycosylase B